MAGTGRPLTALVTGATSGIGKEVARQLLGLGCVVFVGARDAGKGQAVVDELAAGGTRGGTLSAGADVSGSSGGGGVGEARVLVVDVADPKSIAEAVSKVDRLDVLVNNAGINTSSGSLVDADLETFRREYETNVFGLASVTNAFLPLLRESGRARIVNLSSGTGSLAWSAGPNPQFDWQQARGGAAVYRSSKAAVNALTVLYALTLAEAGIKVNALAPGRRATNLVPGLRDATPEQLAARGVGDPAEAAEEAVRLATLPDDGPTGLLFSWDGSVVPW